MESTAAPAMSRHHSDLSEAHSAEAVSVGGSSAAALKDDDAARHTHEEQMYGSEDKMDLTRCTISSSLQQMEVGDVSVHKDAGLAWPFGCACC